MKVLLLVCLLLGCGRRMLDADVTPFDEVEWQSYPSDDEIIRAIAGSCEDGVIRVEMERFAREMLPGIHRTTQGDPNTLTWLLQKYRAHWSGSTLREFLRFAAGEAIVDVLPQAQQLAAARLHADLFPNEPMPEPWEHLPAMDADGAAHAAMPLARRLDVLENEYLTALGRRFDETWPKKFVDPDWDLAHNLAEGRNHLHVAATGDFSVTDGAVYELLTTRHISTIALPGGCY